MRSSARTAIRAIDYGSVVAVLVVGALGGAAIFFQLTEQLGHAHARLSPAEQAFAVAVDTLGLVLMLMAAVQLMLGYRLLHFRPSALRRAHIAMAWSIVSVLALHMSGGIVHSLFQGARETLPIWSDVIGTVSVIVLAGLIASGYLRERPGSARASSARARYVHSWVALTLAVVLVAHGLVGVVHIAG